VRVFYYYGAGPFWVGWVISLVVLAAIITTVVLLARSSRRHAIYPRQWNGGPWQGHWHGGWQSPGLHELDIRYARGEITRDEYLQRRADMLSHPMAPPPGAPPGTQS
jgi:putative membrane protein